MAHIFEKALPGFNAPQHRRVICWRHKDRKLHSPEVWQFKPDEDRLVLLVLNYMISLGVRRKIQKADDVKYLRMRCRAPQVESWWRWGPRCRLCGPRTLWPAGTRLWTWLLWNWTQSDGNIRRMLEKRITATSWTSQGSYTFRSSNPVFYSEEVHFQLLKRHQIFVLMSQRRSGCHEATVMPLTGLQTAEFEVLNSAFQLISRGWSDQILWYRLCKTFSCSICHLEDKFLLWMCNMQTSECMTGFQSAGTSADLFLWPVESPSAGHG